MSENCPKERTINAIIVQSTNQPTQDAGAPQLPAANIIPAQADNDQELIKLWLHGKSKHTQRYYRKDVDQFYEFVNKPIGRIILKDLQDFADHIGSLDLVDGSKRRILSSVKSLFAFAQKLGYLPFDVARVLILPTPKDTLAERILSLEEVKRIIAAERQPRNTLLLKTLFITGIRVSELCSLKWKDLQERSQGGQMIVYGKGQKTRTVLVPEPLSSELMAFRGSAPDEFFIFRGRNRNTEMHPTTSLRIVKKAARKAGIKKNISNHYFRHAHASISAEKAPLHVVQQSLGHASLQTTSRYLHVKPNDCSSNYLEL